MARKKPYLKSGTVYYADPKSGTGSINKDGDLTKIVNKILNQEGVPVVDPCCPPLVNVPVSWNTETDTLQAWIDGAWVDVNNAASGSTTTTSTTTSTSTTTMAP